MKSIEKIVCSAIWYIELPLTLTNEYIKIKPLILPKNIDRGIVFCGLRHTNCMYTMIATTGRRSVEIDCGKYVQGFLTSDNKFVNREQAAIIFVANGGKLNYSSKELFSEDLY